MTVRQDYAAPMELENLMVPIATNMPRLTALGMGRARAALGGETHPVGRKVALAGAILRPRRLQKALDRADQSVYNPFHEPSKTAEWLLMFILGGYAHIQLHPNFGTLERLRASGRQIAGF